MMQQWRKYKRSRRVWIPGLLMLLMLAVSACDGITPISAQAGIPLTGMNSVELRPCEYIPGVSIPAQIPAELFAVGTKPLTSKTFNFANHTVEAAITERQLELFDQIWEAITQDYVLTYTGSKDINAIWGKYEQLIRKGLEQEDFYRAVKQMLVDLDGGLSSFWPPAEVARYAGYNADIGAAGVPAVIDGHQALIVLSVYPDTPASLAGLKNRDVILTVDGEPPIDEYGQPRTRGPADADLTVTVRSPGGPERVLRLSRTPAYGTIDPIDACLVPGIRLGYIHLMSYTNRTAVDQMEEALKEMSANGPLEGLVFDTRMNTGGDPKILDEMLSYFTSGELAGYGSPGNIYPLNILPRRDAAGSQSVHLVILQDETSRPVAESFIAVLQLTGRAHTVGSTIPGPLYGIHAFDLSDRSRLFLPIQTFLPAGKPAGFFDEYGLVPDVLVPARWDLFTEATDPVLSKAVEMLQEQWDGSSFM